MSDDMRHALRVTSGFLQLLGLRMNLDEQVTAVRFKDADLAALGTVTLKQALDQADAALAKADTDTTRED